MRSDALRASWGISDDDVVVLSVGRLSPEKNLSLLVDGFALLPPDIKRSVKLVFVGDGPFKTDLQQLCAARNIPAIFTGQLIGRALGEAFASADIMR
jgi:glycosyltransferase involved in cell wall biosynthesis